MNHLDAIRAHLPHAHDFPKGCRVQTHPGTDRWMMGDRYGTVTRIHPDTTVLANAPLGLVRVRLDKSGDSVLFDPRNLEIIDDTPRGGDA